VSLTVALMIEILVAFLLALTIGYCIIPNSRLKRLKGDEQSLKATISELITATEIAGRAVAGLKATAQECDRTLGERMRAAERLAADMDRRIKAGAAAGGQLSLLDAGAPAPAALDPKAMVARAQAFSERARERLGSLAA
jgi:hypothetical protein